MAVPTWLKVIIVVIALGMLGMCAIAGAGVYFVSQHVSTSSMPATDALRRFEEQRAQFKEQQPVIDIDPSERVTQLRNITELPDGPTPAQTLVVMAWDPTDERIVNFEIPLWVLGIGERKIDLGVGAESLDLRKLNITAEDLRRIGPALLLDLKSPSGDRALIWTK